MQRLIAEGETYLLLLPVYVGLLAGERLVHAWRSRRPWDDRDSAANIAVTAVVLGVDVLVGHLLPVAVFAWLHAQARLWDLSGSALGWGAAFLLHDLAWYVDHRIAHRTGLFWAMHHVHHSSNEYNMTVASRGFVLDNTLLTRPLFFLLPVLGVGPAQFITVRIVTSVWGIAQHTRLVGRLGWLDGVFATPSNHRVHHGTEPQYLDKNYGEVLIVWDRIFGTWQPEGEEPTYGVVERLDSYNPVTIELAGLRSLARRLAAAPDWRSRARCLIKPPGWRPEDQPPAVARPLDR